ncbi:MAG TPA: DUF2156 domain-containing protein [Chloroflexota bacterium]|nr:DUF2156 domain-containing protein [Chloroflexota bacterium]
MRGSLAPLACGLALLLLARGLGRGLRVAWALTLGLLLLAALAAPVNHDDWAVLALLPAAALWLRRQDFTVPARAPRRGYAALLVGLTLLSAAATVPHGLPVVHRHGLALAPTAHAAHGHRRALRASPVRRGGDWAVLLLPGAMALLLLGLRGLTLPGLPGRAVDEDASRDRARRLFDAHGANGVGYFASYATAGGATHLWADARQRGVVAYRVVGNTALVAGDPLAAAADLPIVLDGFLAHCYAHGWTPAFYQTLGATLPHYRARGLRALAIGREAIVDLPTFTLSGKRIANVRHSVTHAERADLRVQLYAAGALDAATRTELRALSDEWLAAKGGAEMGFTMGQLSPQGYPSTGARVAVARDRAGRVQAFLTVVPAGGGRGWLLDLMRRGRDSQSGTMDLLIARTAETLRDEGFERLSLSLAPLASTEDDDEDAPEVARWGRRLLYEKMDGAYNYRSLFNYKKKFAVRWETRYLVYAGDAALPGALYAVARAHLPSPRRVLPRLPVARPGRLWMGQRARGERVA